MSKLKLNKLLNRLLAKEFTYDPTSKNKDLNKALVKARYHKNIWISGLFFDFSKKTFLYNGDRTNMNQMQIDVNNLLNESIDTCNKRLEEHM